MRILITGDLVIDRVYNTKERIDSSLIDLFQSSDYNIVNLEAPVTNSMSKITKTGPNLKAERESTLDVLKTLEINAVTLANNHILDYDEKGVKNTLEFCKENNIQTVGAGKNLLEASKTLYIESDEGRIAIVNFAENEWASATSIYAGANPMDVIENIKQIREAKKNAKNVIVIIHGGHEYYNLPSPRIQKQYRFYAEEGADLIVGHHTHCISGFETWKDVPIYYSLGNFLFTHNSQIDDWYNGLILQVEIISGELGAKFIAIQQEKETFSLSLSKNIVEVEKRIEVFNKTIIDNSLLQGAWQRFIKQKEKQYLNYWSILSFISNKYFRKMFSLLGFAKPNKKASALYLNLTRCEAHRDLSKEVLRKYLEK
ncbi:MAG: CapA family protein [Brumimicrobium sp.]|nr:CapA family protein [Brumimicrobium sp.]